MTDKSARKRRPKRKAWSGDELLDVFVEYVRHKLDLGRGNAMRVLLGRPLQKGLINSEMLTDEVMALKAKLFDDFFRAYGGRLASGLALVADQKRRGQKGAAKRKATGAAFSAEIVKLANDYRRTGRVAERNLAGAIATKMGKHSSHVRRILKKASKTQG